MCTVPAQIFSAPTRAKLIAAARDMPWVCGTFGSSSEACTTRTPCNFQSCSRGCDMVATPSKLFGFPLRRPPYQQALLRARDCEIEHQRESRQHQDAREHG